MINITKYVATVSHDQYGEKKFINSPVTAFFGGREVAVNQPMSRHPLLLCSYCSTYAPIT